MPSGPLAHICLLVEDLDQAIEDWTKILRVLDPEQLEEPIVRYDKFEGGDDTMRWATFVSDDGAEIQLMQPGRTPRSVAGSPSAVSTCITSASLPTIPAAWLVKREARVSTEPATRISDPAMPWQRWSWVMPDSAHGTLVEVARPYRAVDGKWKSRTPGD